MLCSVIATTHNRRPDLEHTLLQLRRLTPAPAEVLICADGCTDGTVEMIRAQFPEVQVLQNAERLGSIPARDRLLRAARSDLVLSLDDDSYPVEPDFLSVAAQCFVDDPKLAVLWFPQRSEEFPASLLQADFGPDTTTATFSSSGAVLRRATYLGLPGYPPSFGHAYEEPDYSLQCIAAGWIVRRHTALTIRHHYSARNRNEIRTHHLHARNEAWSILLRCPMVALPLLLVRRAAGQFGYACRRGPCWIAREPLWWWQMIKGASAVWAQRRTVGWSAYCRWLRLLRHPEPITASETCIRK